MTTSEKIWFGIGALGAIDLAWRGIEVLIRLSPRFLSFQTKLWRFIAETYTVPAFRRKATASRVEEVLNQTAFRLQRHLPKAWVKRARIRWVRKPKSVLFSDGQLILRIRPSKTADENLMQALWIYFRNSIFPNTRDLLPDIIVSAVSLAITRASLEESHQYLLKEFDDTFLTATAERPQEFLDHFGDCVRLNDCGLLMGPFVREIDNAAASARYRSERKELSETIRGMAEHMLSFQPLLRNNKPDNEWCHIGPCSSYGFILVSRPPEIRPEVQAYVNRAQSRVQKEIQRIYLVGRYEEREFFSQVLRAVLRIRELKGSEVFSLFRDYRGDPNGIGALLERDDLLTKLNLTQRPVESIPSPLGATPDAEAGFEEESEDAEAEAQLDLKKIAEDIIVQLSNYEGEWIHLSPFGERIRDQIPGFTPQRYGGRNLIAVLRRLDTLEFDERGLGAVYVRVKATNGNAHKNREEAEDMVRKAIGAIIDDYAQEDGWIFCGALGNRLKDQVPSFHISRFDCESLRDLIARFAEFEIEERGSGHSKTYVRRRPRLA